MKWYKVWTSDLSAPVMLIKAEDQREALKKAKEESRSYDQVQEYKEANKCKFFTKRKQTEWRHTMTGRQYPVEVVAAYCRPHNSPCRCNGERAKCDFYPEVRNK